MNEIELCDDIRNVRRFKIKDDVIMVPDILKKYGKLFVVLGKIPFLKKPISYLMNLLVGYMDEYISYQIYGLTFYLALYYAIDTSDRYDIIYQLEYRRNAIIEIFQDYVYAEKIDYEYIKKMITQQELYGCILPVTTCITRKLKEETIYEDQLRKILDKDFLFSDQYDQFLREEKKKVEDYMDDLERNKKGEYYELS